MTGGVESVLEAERNLWSRKANRCRSTRLLHQCVSRSHRRQSAEKDDLVTIGTVKHFDQCLDDLTVFEGDLQVFDDAIIVSHDETADDERQR